MEGFTIRAATLSDVDYVAAINIESLPEHYPLSFWLGHIESDSAVFYVAEVSGKVVGYALSRVEVVPSHFTPGKMVRAGHIVSIAVREAYRGKGIGTTLMTMLLKALREVQGAEEAFLEVRVSNEPALRLYHKLGFVIVKRLQSYYLDGEDAYLMAKKLV